MHSYRSLMMVAGMAGVMVVMAGVLLNTEQMVRKQRVGPVAQTENWVPLGARRRPSDPTAFDRCLDRIRLLAEAPGSDPAGRELARQIEQAAVLADASVFPRIAALLDEEDLDPRLESAALVLAGASGAGDAAALLEDRYSERPGSALQGLARLGGAAAFDVILRLHAQDSARDARRKLREAALLVDPLRTLDELLAPLAESLPPGEELGAVLAMLGETRSPAATAVIAACLRGRAELDLAFLRAGTAGLLALADQGGRGALAAIVADESLAPGLRRVAGEALTALPALRR